MNVVWVALAVVVVCVAVAFAVRRKRTEAADRRAADERLARAADARHEGAKTRHEGGP